MSEKIQLFLEWPEQGSDGGDGMMCMDGADALIIDPRQCDPMLFERTGVERAVIRNGDPVRDDCWLERPAWWVLDGELEQMARHRDSYPELDWIPRLEVTRARVSYRFSGPAVGEGFSFYMPDTAAVRGWRIDGSERSLNEAYARAIELGFPAVWLHSSEAAARGNGLELDVLDKIRGGPLEVWLSGGATEPKHLQTMARSGGAVAVIVNERLIRGCSMDVLREALLAEESVPESVPIHFERQSARTR